MKSKTATPSRRGGSLHHGESKTLPSSSVTKLTQHFNSGAGVLHAADIFDEISESHGLLGSNILVAFGKQSGDFFGGEILDAEFGRHIEPFL